MYAIAVHGGAGRAPRDPDAAVAGVRRAVAAAQHLLAGGASALDAVTAAVVVLEDDPLFNAGTGSVLNAEGEAELDAGVMQGAGLVTGNVAALRRVRNPVLVARRLLESESHALLAGEGALRFARAVGFPDHDPITAERRAQWQAQRAALARGEGECVRLHAELPSLFGGTVGAVALDGAGGLAAATSTGGVAMKLPGRVGDSPLPGAGNYATPHAAVSATGRGELMMRFVTAKWVCDRVGEGMPADLAATAVLDAMSASVGADCGLIVVDAQGRIGIQHRTEAMVHAWATDACAEISAAIAR